MNPDQSSEMPPETSELPPEMPEKITTAVPLTPEVPVTVGLAKTIAAPDWNNRKLFSLFAPLIIEQLLIVAMGMADMIMVSSVGEHAISGVSLVDHINFLIITAFNALATGGAVVASQYIGRKDGKHACDSAHQLVFISLFISIVLMIFTMIFCTSLLRLVFGNIAEDVMRAATTYFFIRAVSYPFLALYTSCAALFRSMGDSKRPMRVTIIANIVNIGGNALFIFGFKWGVAGAAAATVIGRMVAASLLSIKLIKDNNKIIHLRGILKAKLEVPMLKRILNIGIPSGLETSMFQIGKILVTRIFTAFGTAAMAANAVASTINSLAFMPGSGYGMGLLIVTGQCIGAGDYAGAKRYTKKVMLLAYATYLIININILIFMNPIINIYNLSSEAIDYCVLFLRIHLVTSTLFWCTSFVLPNSLKAAGDARYVMVVTAVSMWLVRVCSAYLMAFPLGLGPAAVSVAMGADFLFRGIFFYTRWKRGKWKEKRVI